MNAQTQFPSTALGNARDDGFALRRITERDFFLPLAIIGGLALLVVTLGTHFAVDAFDRSSAIREQMLARNGIVQRIGEVAQMVVPQTDWDDATAHLDVTFDNAWAEANIGKFLSQTDGFSQSFIVDRDDRLVFASRGGLQATGSSFRPIAPLAAPLLDSVRRDEAARGTLRPLPSGGMISRAIQASTLAMIDGKLSILTATLVQPDFGKALPMGKRSPAVITAMPVDQDFLDVFAKRYMMEGLHIRAIGDPARAGDVEIPAQDRQGKALAYFAWKPLDPGYTMLREFLPSIGLVLLTLAALAFYQLRKVHQAARELLAREKEYQQMLAEMAAGPNFSI